MYCTQCGAEVSGDYCTYCGAKLLTVYNKAQGNKTMNIAEIDAATEADKPFYQKKWFYILAISVAVFGFVIIAMCIIDINKSNSGENQKEVSRNATTQSATIEGNKETYGIEDFCDIVEESCSIVNIYGHTVAYLKVIAKANVTIEVTLVAYDSNQNVIGKSTDSIVLTKGKTNYFRFSFSEDISEIAHVQTLSASATGDSFLTGERDAVEMVTYNQSGSYLYITLKQTGNDIGSFAKFKILYYKNNEIIGDDYGYFSLQAQNLNGKGSTDVVKVLNYSYMDFDKIEFIYEP